MSFVKPLKVSDSLTIDTVTISKDYYDYLLRCDSYITKHKIKIKQPKIKL
jgi:hypothetical protein